MSTRYDLECVEHHQDLPFENGSDCYDKEALGWLVSERDKIIALVEAASRVASIDLTYEASNYIAINPSWFVEHRNCPLRVRDEYGRYIDDCNAQVFCDCCGTRKDCKLPPGHEGPHSIKPRGAIP